MIRAVWDLSPNVGDALTPWLIEKISGQKAVYTSFDDHVDKFIVCGSMLNWADRWSICWGPGLAVADHCVNPEAKIHAVRGPLSRARAVSDWNTEEGQRCANKRDVACPEIYGDPAILCPRFFTPSTSRDENMIGLVPHYTDLLYAMETFAVSRGDERVTGKYRVIDPLQPVERFIDELCSCGRVLSSSLHGIILAHAYGIPASWVRIGNRIGGDGTKFRDYYLFVGKTDPMCFYLLDNSQLPIERAWLPDVIDSDPLMAHCPFG